MFVTGRTARRSCLPRTAAAASNGGTRAAKAAPRRPGPYLNLAFSGLQRAVAQLLGPASSEPEQLPAARCAPPHAASSMPALNAEQLLPQPPSVATGCIASSLGLPPSRQPRRCRDARHGATRPAGDAVTTQPDRTQPSHPEAVWTAAWRSFDEVGSGQQEAAPGKTQQRRGRAQAQPPAKAATALQTAGGRPADGAEPMQPADMALQVG